MNLRLHQAFTLIELLIVIVIIGILATALIPRLTGMQDKARYARVEKDFRDFKTAVFLAQSTTGKLLKDITLSSCTACSCSSLAPLYTPLTDIRNLSSSHVCRANFLLVLQKVAVAAGMEAGDLDYMALDPWGSPYRLDENEGEFGADGCSAKDTITTVGPDGSFINGSDNKNLLMAPSGCPGGY